MSALDSVRRALVEAYGKGIVLGDETADDLIKAVVTEMDAQAYPGELAMLRGLVATLRVVAQHGDLADVVKLLDEHQRDEQDAYAEAPAVSDGPAGPTGRVARLLDAIRTARGRWTTARAAQFYRDHQLGPPRAKWPQIRTVARGDLRDLAAWGHLVRHEEPGRIYFVQKGGAR